MQSMLDQFMRVRFGSIVVPIEAVMLSAVLGIGMTVLAGLLPAISAGRVPVRAALREEQVVQVQKRTAIDTLIGAGLVVLGIASLFLGNTGLATLGSVLILAGLVVMTHLLLSPIARTLEPITRRLFAGEGMLAEGNLQHNPGRAAITVSALLIALLVIVALASMFSSIQDTFISSLNRSSGADVLLLPPNLALWSSNVGVGQEFEQ